jgi:hypothetical protein
LCDAARAMCARAARWGVGTSMSMTVAMARGGDNARRRCDDDDDATTRRRRCDEEDDEDE